MDFFRGADTNARRFVRDLEQRAVPFGIPLVCCQELLQGARDRREWKALHDVLCTQRLLAPRDGWAVHVAAARIYFDARRRGITLRSTVDCFIAALAIEHDGLLAHADGDYERMARVCDLETIDLRQGAGG